MNNKEWRLWNLFGNKNCDDSMASIALNDKYHLRVNEEQYVPTDKPYEVSICSYHLMQGDSLIASINSCVLSQNGRVHFDESSYVLAFDQHDQVLHDTSMAVLRSFSEPTKTGGVIVISGLEVEQCESNKNELAKILFDATIANESKRTDIDKLFIFNHPENYSELEQKDQKELLGYYNEIEMPENLNVKYL